MSSSRAATVRKAKPDPNVPVRGRKAMAKLFTGICEQACTPLSLRAFYMMKEGDFLGLATLDFDPFFYQWNDLSVEDFRHDYQIASFWKKYQDFDLDIDRKGVAMEKWLESEVSCRRINELFRSRWEGKSQPFSFPVEEVLHLARRKITKILGTIKPCDIEYIRSSCRHGPGSDLSVRRSLATSYEKFRTPGSITQACYRAYEAVFDEQRELSPDYRHDIANNAEIVLAERLTFVPKTAKTDRPISIGPRWNVYIQLGIGDLISKRLRSLGIDIRNQTRNQDSARRATDHGLATIDLSSASDRISTNLVIDLLSTADPLWLDLLLWTRCAYTDIGDGKVVRLDKISAMGNGYTFPLETLLFYAIAWAAAHFERCDTKQVLAYGDDIVVPRKCSSLLVECLESYGFAVNTEKSYFSGLFFESCGKDFYKGCNVRPFFVTNEVRSVMDAMVLYNKVVAWSHLYEVLYDRQSIERAKALITAVPAMYRYFGPTHLSGVFHAPFDKSVPKKCPHGWESYMFRCIVPVTVSKRRYHWFGHLYTKISSDVDSGNSVLVRDAPEAWRTKWVTALPGKGMLYIP